MSERLYALRGAITVTHNNANLILEATEELMRELIERNDLAPERMVSCLFTCTADLNAEFPAVAARQLGLGSVPLLCTREMDVPGALRGVIRVMLHFYAEPGFEPQHAYLREAKKLRTDLHGAQ